MDKRWRSTPGGFVGRRFGQKCVFYISNCNGLCSSEGVRPSWPGFFWVLVIASTNSFAYPLGRSAPCLVRRHGLVYLTARLVYGLTTILLGWHFQPASCVACLYALFDNVPASSCSYAGWSRKTIRRADSSVWDSHRVRSKDVAGTNVPVASLAA